MNEQNRLRIGTLNSRIAAIITEVLAMREDEFRKLNNIPEALQGEEMAQGMETAIEALDDAEGALLEAKEALSKAASA